MLLLLLHLNGQPSRLLAMPSADVHATSTSCHCCCCCPHTVRLRVEAGKRAAAKAAVVAAAPQLLQPELAFSTGTYLMVPVYIVLAFWPRSKLVRLAGWLRLPSMRAPFDWPQGMA